MTLLDELDAAAKQPSLKVVAPTVAYPGAEVLTDLAAGTCEVTWAVPVDEGGAPPDPGEALGFELAGLDPAEWAVVANETKLDPAAWTRDTPEQNRAVTRAIVRRRWAFRRRANPAAAFDVAAAVKLISKAKPPKAAPAGGSTLVFCASDWQLGKTEALSGLEKHTDGETSGTVDCILRAAHRAAAKVKRLARTDPVTTIALVGMGDLIERCQGNYPSQAHVTDLGEEQQRLLGLALVNRLIEIFLATGCEVVVTSVGGNHGENRNGSKAFTTTADNADLGLLQAAYQCWKMLADAGVAKAGRVRFHFADHPLIVALNLGGVNVAFTHGHLARGTGGQVKWWKDQAFAFGELAAAGILVTAHYHHWSMTEWSSTETGGAVSRLWAQCPAADPGSEWFTNGTGANSTRGQLTFVVGPDPDRAGVVAAREWAVL